MEGHSDGDPGVWTPLIQKAPSDYSAFALQNNIACHAHPGVLSSMSVLGRKKSQLTKAYTEYTHNFHQNTTQVIIAQ